MVKIPLLPNNVGKKSVNDTGPRQGHDTNKSLKPVAIRLFTNDSALDIIKKNTRQVYNLFQNLWKKTIWFSKLFEKGCEKVRKE